MVKKMAPAIGAGSSTTRPTFKPSMDDTYNATYLH